MAVTIDIGLNSPFILIGSATSEQGLQVTDENVQFGIVEQIFEGSLKCVIGQIVLFTIKGATNLKAGEDSYWVVDEKNIFFNELVAP